MPIDHEPILEVTGLRKSFPAGPRVLFRQTARLQAVSGVDFKVGKSRTLALVGESGSGKTTVARMILLLEHPDAGDVVFARRSILNANGRELLNLRREIQMVFQDPYASLNPHMTVARILGEPLRRHRVCAAAEVRDRTLALLAEVGLGADALGKYPHEFSGGQRQRIGIARALSVNPKLIICDEPVSALDVSIRAQILNLLMQLQADLGLSYIFIGHDLAVVRHISDHVAVMYMGKIVEMAPKQRFFAAPIHPYSEALLSATPTHDPKSKSNRIALSGEMPSPLDPPSGCRFHTRCPLAEPICTREEPPLAASASGHLVACHLRG